MEPGASVIGAALAPQPALVYCTFGADQVPDEHAVAQVEGGPAVSAGAQCRGVTIDAVTGTILGLFATPNGFSVYDHVYWIGIASVGESPLPIPAWQAPSGFTNDEIYSDGWQVRQGRVVRSLSFHAVAVAKSKPNAHPVWSIDLQSDDPEWAPATVNPPPEKYVKASRPAIDSKGSGELLVRTVKGAMALWRFDFGGEMQAIATLDIPSTDALSDLVYGHDDFLYAALGSADIQKKNTERVVKLGPDGALLASFDIASFDIGGIEGIAAAADGTLYVGTFKLGLGPDGLYRLAPGKPLEKLGCEGYVLGYIALGPLQP